MGNGQGAEQAVQKLAFIRNASSSHNVQYDNPTLAAAAVQELVDGRRPFFQYVGAFRSVQS